MEKLKFNPNIYNTNNTSINCDSYICFVYSRNFKIRKRIDVKINSFSL